MLSCCFLKGRKNIRALLKIGLRLKITDNFSFSLSTQGVFFMQSCFFSLISGLFPAHRSLKINQPPHVVRQILKTYVRPGPHNPYAS